MSLPELVDNVTVAIFNGSMNAFFTGSRVYGTPRPDSDWDLCILADQKTAELLESHRSEGGAIRFGDLNLIVLQDEKAFELWRQGTEELIAQRPVTREQAVAHLKSLRLKGLSG